MRILLYSISYSPEVAGSGRFNGELTEWLAQQGHKVDVITAHPYYPEWRIRPEYKRKGWLIERKGNLTIYRTPLYVPEQITGKTRILHELSFAVNSLIHWGHLLFKKHDVIIGVCPPLLAGLIPYIAGRLKRKPFVFHIQDLQVDAARNLGLIKNEKLLGFLDGVERYVLRHADRVSSISEGMKQNILRKGTSEANYFMLENWTDIDTMCPMPAQDALRAGLGFIRTDKIILYSGNIGEKQGLEILIDTASHLAQRTDINFVVVGEGAARKRLIEQAKKQDLKNIHFLDPIPYEDLPKMLAMADIHLVLQKRATSDLVMPSKLVNILSVGGTVIVSAEKNTSLSSVLLNNKLGWVVEPERSDLLADKILLALNSPDSQQYRVNARCYAESYLSKRVILPRFEALLFNLITYGRQ